VQDEEEEVSSGRRHALALFAALALAFALGPAAAHAETRTFVHTSNLSPSGGASTEGPANEYPASINVSGLSGTVTKVSVTLIGYGSSSPADTDAAIVGPNGQQVMLISDACGETDAHSVHFENWTFDDAAQGFLSSVDCAPDFQDASFKPSNYGNPDDDDLSAAGGPAGPYLNSLSLLAGGSPNGAWNLFVFDDNDVGYHGFDISGWALNLEIQPPPATPATPPTTSSPAPPKKCKKKRKKAAAAKKCKKKR
jgi:hypothetical protein